MAKFGEKQSWSVQPPCVLVGAGPDSVTLGHAKVWESVAACVAHLGATPIAQITAGFETQNRATKVGLQTLNVSSETRYIIQTANEKLCKNCGGLPRIIPKYESQPENSQGDALPQERSSTALSSDVVDRAIAAIDKLELNLQLLRCQVATQELQDCRTQLQTWREEARIMASRPDSTKLQIIIDRISELASQVHSSQDTQKSNSGNKPSGSTLNESAENNAVHKSNSNISSTSNLNSNPATSFIIPDNAEACLAALKTSLADWKFDILDVQQLAAAQNALQNFTEQVDGDFTTIQNYLLVAHKAARNFCSHATHLQPENLKVLNEWLASLNALVPVSEDLSGSLVSTLNSQDLPLQVSNLFTPALYKSIENYQNTVGNAIQVEGDLPSINNCRLTQAPESVFEIFRFVATEMEEIEQQLTQNNRIGVNQKIHMDTLIDVCEKMRVVLVNMAAKKNAAVWEGLESLDKCLEIHNAPLKQYFPYNRLRQLCVQFELLTRNMMGNDVCLKRKEAIVDKVTLLLDNELISKHGNEEVKLRSIRVQLLKPSTREDPAEYAAFLKNASKLVGNLALAEEVEADRIKKAAATASKTKDEETSETKENKEQGSILKPQGATPLTSAWTPAGHKN